MESTIYQPTQIMTKLNAEARARYVKLDTETLLKLRDAFVELALTPGQEEATYWAARERVITLDDVILSRRVSLSNE